MPLHPILKQLGLRDHVETIHGTPKTKKQKSNGTVSSLEVLSYLLGKGIIQEDSIRSAVQALSKQPDLDSGATEKADEPTAAATLSTPPTTPNSNKKDYRTRHVALRFLYDGANFSGLAQNVGQDSDNSVERALFQALTRARLVESRETSGYSRCGRTDRGVSAAGQVVALRLKSVIPLDASLDEEGTQLLDDNNPSQQLPKNEHEKLSVWVVPRKRNKSNASNDSSTLKERRVLKELAEYPYAKILNNLLPPEIRILGWAPVSDEFSARFSATTRTYRYFFVRRQLDLQQMQAGLDLMVGKHDFRNFCKMDVEKVYNFERIIHNAQIMIQSTPTGEAVPAKESLSISASPYQMCYAEIHGQAFLWHQIRCIMEVLFLIGNHLEKPSVVVELFNVEKYPGKPAYPLAPEKPLVLNDCGYPNLQIGYAAQNVWNVTCQLEQQWDELILAAARIRNGIAAFETVSVLQDDLIQFASSKIVERKRKLQKSGLLSSTSSIDETNLSNTLPTNGSNTTLCWKDALVWLSKTCDLTPDCNGLNTAIHIPLLQRSQGTTYEEKVEALQKSDKRRQKYQENVIKKRKTAEEDAAFYSHKTQQGGTGM